jgi:hypothetical protein
MNFRRIPALLPVLGPLFATLACNVSQKGTEEHEPCSYDGETLENGEEIESIDGCMTLACTAGVLVTAEDRRAIVTGDLELATQEAVDAQVCLGTVEGTLRITGTAADLTTLGSLQRVGALDITASEAVTLTGLGGLAEVSGALTLADNAALTTLAFLPTMSVFGDLTIRNNDALASLAGAEFIGSCGSCIAIAGGPSSITDRNEPAREPAGDGGFGGDEVGGGTFYGNILIEENDVLADVQAMGNLVYAWGDLRFRSNAALASLAGLQVFEVRGNLEITGHAAMPEADADAFALDVTVVGTTTICGNMGGEVCP